MKHLQLFEEFINEGVLKQGSDEVEYDIDRSVWIDNYGSEKELAETIRKDLKLKKGYIEFSGSFFEVKGETIGGNTLFVEQSGEYDKYGGPYEPIMKNPTVKLNDKDILSSIKKEFNKYGWDSPMIDISRTDIWGDVVK